MKQQVKIIKSSPMLHREVINTIINIVIMTLGKEKEKYIVGRFLREKYVIVLEIILSKSQPITCFWGLQINKQSYNTYNTHIVTSYSRNMIYLLSYLFLERL